MLVELKDVRQNAGEPRRRWFQSQTEDLVVWFGEDGTISHFQLCYDRGGRERALTWTAGAGFSHRRVDDGESEPLVAKRTPVLVADGSFDAPKVLALFLAAAEEMPFAIAAFVAGKLRGYPAV